MHRFRQRMLAYLLLLCTATYSSCSKNSNQDLGIQNGLLMLAFSPKPDRPYSDSLSVTILSDNGTPILFYPSLNDFPLNGVSLSTGSYRIAITPNNKRVPLFERTIYEGKAGFTVSPTDENNLTVNLTPQTFGVKIFYSNSFKNGNSSYYTIVSSPEGNLTYTASENRVGNFITGPIEIKTHYTDSKGTSKTHTSRIEAGSPLISPGANVQHLVNPESSSELYEYYKSTSGKTGVELKAELTKIISNGFKSQSYSALWGAYLNGDIRADGTGAIWDIYSDKPNGTIPYLYQPTQDQCGNYVREGDCYNREHTVPKSWFKEESPMYSDYLHILPTDGYVNSRRSNYPYGEVSTIRWESKNGSKLGTAKPTLGYSGTVFEPIDEYKGDVARIYFYFVTRYADKLKSYDVNNGTSQEVFNSNSYGLDQWVIDMMMRWSKNDPVSIKEIERNNAAHKFQNNRNPYVDHPEFIEMIWGATGVL